MASLKQMRGKYYSRIRQWNGVKQIERLIPLKTRNKTDARLRHFEVEKYENDIKDGMEFDFPWLNSSGGRTNVKPKSLVDTIDLFIDYRLTSENLRPKTIDINQRALNLFIEVVGNISIKSINMVHTYARNHSLIEKLPRP